MTNAVPATPWLTWPKSKPRATLRLFCFPYAGGGALAFRNWSDYLPMNVEVCPVQLPGRETRIKESALTRVSPMVQAIAEVIRPCLDVPFACFGHSMGALIAFELARELRGKYGVQPLKLYVSGRVAPHLPLLRTPLLHDLPELEFMDALRHLKGTPEAVLENEALMALVMPLLRADFAVNEVYRYSAQPRLDCPILAMGGLHDSEAGREQLEAWRQHTSASFELRMFPGDHFYLNTTQPLLLQVLSQDLARLAKVT